MSRRAARATAAPAGTGDDDLSVLTATDAAAMIRDGRVTARELTEACLDRIAAREDAIGAWTVLDPGHARAQADAADRARKEGAALGALHGVPVGIKDLFDTAELPTGYGSPLYEGHRPRRDAAAVAFLRRAGAVVMGKTVTTEFATYTPGKTRNPHDPARTPGGSSSGSAAAVADRMVPLAIGTQTNGSVIRPAAYCGVVGYKPTHGLIGRTGAFLLSRALDHVGVFARTVADAALAAETLMAFDPEDPDMRARAAPDLVAAAAQTLAIPPRLAFVRTPAWPDAEPGLAEAFAELVEALGVHVEEVRLPAAFDDAIALHARIMEADVAFALDRDYARGKAQLSPGLRGMIERGRAVGAVAYHQALARTAQLRAELEELFAAYDGVVTPAAPGEAPLGLGSTGKPVFCTLWTLLGVPAVTLPLLSGPAGLPIGVQVVADRGDDARLIRLCRWFESGAFLTPARSARKPAGHKAAGHKAAGHKAAGHKVAARGTTRRR